MPTGPVIRSTVSHSPFVPGAQAPEAFTLVLFGATGDLAARKLLPALAALWRNKLLPEHCAVIGTGRRAKSDDEFRADTRAAIAAAKAELPEAFLANVFYQAVDFTTKPGMQKLADRVLQIEKDHKLPGNRLFYLATDPEFFQPIIENLTAVDLTRRNPELPWGRVVIEKPFGSDLASARELDHALLQHLRRDQLYRIDHYLGKETVQNLLAFRFGNPIFEPLFHRHFVDHVQITVAETVGMEGRRGAYYDHAGALRDVLQNHMLQLLALIAMDAPATLKARDIGDAKLKVLRSLPAMDAATVARQVVRGQYGAGTVGGKPVPAYRDEEAVPRDSTTEPYVALRTSVENWRWAGVPFLLRTGKRLPQRVTEIALQFKQPPLHLFRTVECAGDFCDLTEAQPTVLAFRIQPDEGISLAFSAKRPGMQFSLSPVRFDFDYEKAFEQPLSEAYERLLLDALRGDPTLFMPSDELEAAWEFVTPILEAWEKTKPDFPNYAAGTWGPAAADRLVAHCCAGGWRQP